MCMFRPCCMLFEQNNTKDIFCPIKNKHSLDYMALISYPHHGHILQIFLVLGTTLLSIDPRRIGEQTFVHVKFEFAFMAA